jgi:hypothetical protein
MVATIVLPGPQNFPPMPLQSLTAYLKEEISASDLSQLLDEHLYMMIRLCAATGEAITEEQASAYHHIRRLRDLIGEIEVEQEEVISA